AQRTHIARKPESSFVGWVSEAHPPISPAHPPQTKQNTYTLLLNINSHHGMVLTRRVNGDIKQD
ncbi:hypothetical protein ACMGPR_003316, partial [Cronobacter malonaticus]